jgi:hypothetical protein
MSYRIVTQKDRKLEIVHGNRISVQYTVLMYLEVLCKLCLVQLQRATRIECWFLSAHYTQLNKHKHKCFISDVTEAKKRWPNHLSSERLLSTKSYSNSICLNILHVQNKNSHT